MQVGEVGELSEIFQWKGEVPKGLPDWKEEEKVHLGEELSDVLLYLVRLSDICGVDLGKAALRKVELNAIKYPAKVLKEEVSGKQEQEQNSLFLQKHIPFADLRYGEISVLCFLFHDF
ncbi:hypothetical protein RIF29_00424 [Crotalaria pallida]|uniref:dCTP pyrophosphatase 1 n=1 Tax=Crotalaria pallida TaxID=3830 RepID=A0AAN9IW41_CROPI